MRPASFQRSRILFAPRTWSAPVLATANALAAPIAHAGLHVAAVTHSYDTDLFLPPH